MFDLASKLYEKVQNAIKALPQADRENPDRWESVVYRAAAESGVKPRSVRTSDDDFVLGSSAGAPKASPKKEDDIDPRTVEFAKLMGIDPVKDKDRMERIKTYSKRDFKRRG